MSDELAAEEITELAEVFPPPRAARVLLRAAEFPMAAIPGVPDTSLGFWEQISESLANGLVAHGRDRIMAAALRRFPANKVFQAALVRQPARSARPGPWRVLVMGASPLGADPIGADRDAKAIITANRGHLQVELCPAASATDLRRVLDFRPDILHLACHGDADDLIFEDIHGEEHRVAAQDVADTLKLYHDLEGVKLRGLVLASCDSDRIAAMFIGVAERIVAHRSAFGDTCAVAHTRHLYEALELLPDLGEAARIAAQHVLLEDRACADVVTNLVILPDPG